MGETSYYYPCTILCREKFRNGEMGEFAYAESQYLHDMEHMYESFRRSGGDDWKRVAGIPPMFYCSHSVSMILSVTGAHAVKVSCLGYEDHHEDAIFRKGANEWDNVFSNQSALLRTSDGGVARVNEMRRVGFHGADSVYMNFYGTEACYEQNPVGTSWNKSRGRHHGAGNLHRAGHLALWLQSRAPEKAPAGEFRRSAQWAQRFACIPGRRLRPILREPSPAALQRVERSPVDRPRSDCARVGEERRGDAGDSGSWGSAVRGFSKTLHGKLDWIA